MSRKTKSRKDNQCEAHFLNTISRCNDGRYVVRLPFRETKNRLGDSRTMALKRLLSLERKLNECHSKKTTTRRYSRSIYNWVT